MQTLNNTFDSALKFNGPDFFKKKVPEFLHANLRKSHALRPYQLEAFGRFSFYWKEYHDRNRALPTQLLFHMATGSGKTLVMAGIILFLYEQGYRNFLFFVNSSNIIDKTRDNFFNLNSSKYLFDEQIEISARPVNIREVDNFQAANSDDINIVFSTIQGLHSKLNNPKENSLSYDDFETNKIVLLSDEAHHINADTKKGALKTEELEEIVSWEDSIRRIFNANAGNILLEFTATADLTLPEIQAKYNDKLIFDYPLKQFRIDGYSKEVKVLQADLPPFERALQAVLLSQYRLKIFSEHKKHIKPVLLFKSKTIKESQSFFNEFIARMSRLTQDDLSSVFTPDNTIMAGIMAYFLSRSITPDNLVDELKESFHADKLIEVNSKEESEQKQLALNSLEEERNEYRAVFAVDKLNEGWDVLNLFDIVRLYDTRDAKNGKPGKTTMTEAQLIGRGARYCPFSITPEEPKYLRKYDADLNNILRICEELYYHSGYNPRYIQELNTALEEIGIKASQTIEREFKVKQEFKNTGFYQKGVVFLNEQKPYLREDVFGLKTSIIQQHYRIDLKTGSVRSSLVFSVNPAAEIDRKEQQYFLSDFGIPLIRKAINSLEFYEFANLRIFFPNLSSITEFIESDLYLKKITVDVSGLAGQVEALTQKEKLEAAIKVLSEIAQKLQADKVDYKGSKEFKPQSVSTKIKDKTLSFALNEGGDREFGRSMNSSLESAYYLDLTSKDWFVFEDFFGTSEEKLLIKYIDKVSGRFKENFEEIFLVRNEKFFKIYNFADGRAVEPDFVLFLTNRKTDVSVHYQIFIEPKGAHLLETDKWKEDLLKSLREEHNLQQLWQDRQYIIWGLPFYNDQIRKVEFDQGVDLLSGDQLI